MLRGTAVSAIRLNHVRSTGSGTKLAMEDGIALARALTEADDLEDALSRYEAERRPAVEHLQETAYRSMEWRDSFPGRLDLPAEQLLVSFMTRAGKVRLDRSAGIAPDVVRRGLAQYAGCPVFAVPHDDLVARVRDQAGNEPVVVASGRVGLVDLAD
jgi:anthraniloyl-CoA monooxygenase